MIPFITRKVLFPFPSSFSTSVKESTIKLRENCIITAAIVPFI